MSNAPWEPEPGGEHLVAPQRRHATSYSATSLPAEGVRRSHGPRLRLQIPDLSAPALSSTPAATAVAAGGTAETTVAKPPLSERIGANFVIRELRRQIGMAFQVALVRNFALLLQPQILLQPKMVLAGLGAIIMTAATMIVSGQHEVTEADQGSTAPAWTPPALAAPDWSTVAQPVTAPTSDLPKARDAENTISVDSEAPTWAPQTSLPMTATAPPAAVPNYPTTASSELGATPYVTVPGATANEQATAPRGPETVASRPEVARPYPATFAPEAPPQARITGNITVLPGEATP